MTFNHTQEVKIKFLDARHMDTAGGIAQSRPQAVPFTMSNIEPSI